MMAAATLLLALALLATVMLARRWGVLGRFAALGAIGRRSVRIMARRGASDCSKERAARLLAMRLMGRSLAAGAGLALAAAPLAAALALGPWLGLPTLNALFDPLARAAILCLGISLALIRFVLGRIGRAHGGSRRGRLSPA
ncbi:MULTISPECIES: hypothetical protein [unclassified Novosphingobium]|uniref:hypothetical protein n=1 Tax=unclassified Novosphingobium TaxID=2644732 RepID=UPI001446F9F3|nr:MULTISPECIES: hypothetical protein [unclassified Novosphingobium]NKJ43969.1 hypothetical protein [Novosphingobium sp. SG720]NMN05308.1 hypothetical protein [Novosphingobium sp. SG919]NMN87603.1 hypothetical protein [Novosphingobium sp. SG916]